MRRQVRPGPGHRRGALAGLVLAGLTWPPPPPGLAASVLPTCTIAPAFSPTFDRDGTAFCLGKDKWTDTRGWLYVTANGGRTWEKRTADGLTYPPGTVIGRTWVSPNYMSDRTFYIGVSTGLYASTDGGKSFGLVSNRVGEGGSPNFGLTPYLEPQGFPASVPGLPAGPHTAFAYASLRDDDLTSSRLDYLPVPIPVSGSPGDDERFLVPRQPSTGPFAFALARVANDPATNEDDTYQLFGCTRDFTCQTELYRFPLGGPMYLQDYAFAADYSTSRTLYLHFGPGPNQRSEIWRSTDGGQSFRHLPEATKLIAALPSASSARVAIAVHPSRPNRVHLLLSYGVSPWRAGMPPAVQLFQSDDDGARWNRIGWQLGEGQAGKRGALPMLWTSQLSAPGADKLFALGSNAAGDSTLYCSVDAGRNWRQTCLR